MLILTRGIGESIMIRDDIKIIILRAQGNQVEIGIHASREIPVYREEIYQKNLAKNQATKELINE